MQDHILSLEFTTRSVAALMKPFNF